MGELHCKFLLDQKQAEVNTQWAAERLAVLKDRSAKGRDAFSIVAQSVEAFSKGAPKVNPRRRNVIELHKGLVPQPAETVATETQCPADSQRSSPTVPSTPRSPPTPRARPSTPRARPSTPRARPSTSKNQCQQSSFHQYWIHVPM